MSRNKTAMLLALAFLTTFALGCGLLDSLTKKASDKGTEIVEQGKATIEAAVTEAVAEAPAATEVAAEQEEPTAAPTEPASEPVSGDTIDLSALTPTEDLDSFRMTAVITWTNVMTDGTSESGTMEMRNEIDRASESSRFTMSGEWPDMTGGLGSDGGMMELVQIGSSMYMNSGDGEWVTMQMSAEDVQDQFGWDADPSEFAHGTGTFVKTETANGYAAKRYHYSESGVGDLGFGQVDESSSDVWVAEVGSGADAATVIVKVDTTFSGVDIAGTEWSGGMQVDVTDINEPVVIAPPEGVEPPGMPEDVPIMDGAANVQSMMGINTFEVDATVDEVIAFYDDEMPANGWTAGDNSTPGVRQYTKDGREATLMVEEKDSGSSVTLMVAEQ